MRFWITKNSELSIREQLVRQVVLGIISEDLPAGHKLPSIRALARRHQIHSNTVSAAYHDLLDRGWLELKRGSGLYVRPLQRLSDDAGELDSLISGLLRAAKVQGHEPDAVLRRMHQLVHPCRYERVVVVEEEAGMREILHKELSEQLRVPVDALSPATLAGTPSLEGRILATLSTRADSFRDSARRGAACVMLRLRSVRGSLEGQQRPDPDAIVSIASRSLTFREGARMMLIAVGLDPQCLTEVDATLEGWQERTSTSALVITDVVAATGLPPGRPYRVFRVIADSSIDEVKQLCGN